MDLIIESLKSSYKKNKVIFILLAIFIITRIGYYKIGVRYDDSTIDSFWQYLDLGLLKENLFESLFYLHSQPPFFNLILGITLKLFPESYGGAFHFLYMLMGFLMYVFIFKMLRVCKFNITLALIFSSLFVIHPSVILYENFLFYTYPIIFLLIACSYNLMKYLINKDKSSLILFCMGIVILCYIRSLFHLIFPIIIFGVLLFLEKDKMIYHYKLFLISIVLVLSLFFKNWFIFDTFSSSSWLGLSLWKNYTYHDVLPESGSLENNYSFKNISYYPKEYQKVPQNYTGIKSINDTHKGNQRVNFNFYGYINLSKDYKTLFLNKIIENPTKYAKNIIKSFGIYFKPVYDYSFLDDNRAKVNLMIEIYSYLNPLYALEKLFIGKDFYIKGIPLSKFLFTTLLFVAFVWIILKKKYPTELKMFYFFVFFITSYIMFVGNLIEIGENNRFRLLTSPMMYLCIIISINNIRKSVIGNNNTYSS